MRNLIAKGNFVVHPKEGVEVTNYITNLFLLMEIRDKLGFDVNQYLEKCIVMAFEFENVIYVWENDHDKRLTIDQSANQEIMKVFYEIFYNQKKCDEHLFSLLQPLPFTEGEAAQKAFDIIWYRYSKQTPLTYRCFPNTFPFNQKCLHKGEYCIKQDKIDLRYDRFLELHDALNQNEKEELLLTTIDYFNKFIKTDCFEKTIHKNIYINLLEKLNKINEERQPCFSISTHSNDITQPTNEELANARFQQDKDGSTKEENVKIVNPYPRIFKDPKAFELFEYLFDYFNGTEIKHSDCSFIFGQMKKDGYILEGVRDKEFRDFLRNGFNSSLSGETLLCQIDRTKLKTLEFCKSDSRMREYLRISRSNM